MPKILFLTTAHRYDDDRIFYHQAKTLRDYGCQIKICSLSSEFQGIVDGIQVESYSVLDKNTEEKKAVFQKITDDFKPDCIICSEPLAIISTQKIRKDRKVSVIYDITE